MSVASPPSEKTPAGDRRPRPGDADFDAIYDAVMATDRGRWFLFEYARRNREADTAMVLAAIDRLMAAARVDAEARVTAARSSPDPERLRNELADMANVIARTRAEMAAADAANPDGDRSSTGEHGEPLDVLVRSSERTTSHILAAASQIQEMAWALREQGTDAEVCDRLDGHATTIYAACSLDALNGQRTRKVIHVQRYLEARIQAMASLWDAVPQGAKPVSDDPAAAEPVQGKPTLDEPTAGESSAEMPTPDESAPDKSVFDESVPAKPVSDESVPATPVPDESVPDEPVPDEPVPDASLPGPVADAEPRRADAMPASQDATASDQDWVIADLRAFAANIAQSRHDDAALAPEALALEALAPEALALEAPAPEEPALEEPAPKAPAPEALKLLLVAEPPAIAAAMPAVQAAPQPIAAAPQLAGLRRAPRPETPHAARIDIAEELFADVMALSEAERIALFS
jgi:hypothetical protein